MSEYLKKVYLPILLKKNTRNYFFANFCMEIYCLIQTAISLPIFLELMLSAYKDGNTKLMYRYLLLWLLLGVFFLLVNYYAEKMINGKFYYLTLENVREHCLKMIYHNGTLEIDKDYDGNSSYVFLSQNMENFVYTLFYISRIVADFLVCAFFVVWSFKVGSWLALIVVVGALLTPIIGNYESKNVNKINEEANQKKAQYIGSLKNIFSGTESYLANQQYDYVSYKCIDNVDNYIESMMSVAKRRAHRSNVMSWVDGIVYILLILMSILFLSSEEASVVLVLISVYKTNKLYMGSISSKVNFIKENEYIAEQYTKISNTKQDDNKIDTTDYILEADNVCYSVGGHEIIHNLSFSMEANKKIAIIGKNGSGKTTLLKLLLSLIFPSSGLVRRNSSKQLAYVSVNPQLFPVSIEENVSYGCSRHQIDEMRKWLDYADVLRIGEDRITEVLPDGDENLSGGEAQRVAIARAMISENDVIILDEPTSNLDTVTSQKVFRNITNLFNNILFTTHNPEMLSYADVIYIMDNGEIVGCGSYDEIKQLEIYKEWECEVLDR